MGENRQLNIPDQHFGAQSNCIAQEGHQTEEAAIQFYQRCLERLRNVSCWQHYAGQGTATFKLCDKMGIPVQRFAELHDHFRIDGPGPGSITGGGYDWAQIEHFEQMADGDHEHLLFRVRPVSNPLNDKTDTAHFFTDDSTSTFLVQRNGTAVSVEVHGRNEKPNVEAKNLFDKARNAVAGAVAVTMYSKFEWKSLVEGIVNSGD